MWDEFKDLHDKRESDSIPFFSFYDNDGILLRGDLEVSVDEDGQFDLLTQTLDDETFLYPRGNYTYTTECLYVLGIGFLLPGDIVKLSINTCREYELNYGWHTNVSNQTIYSWYLVPHETKDHFEGQRQGLFNKQDPDITNTGILTFYKEYLKTIEVVEFRKDRNSFNII